MENAANDKRKLQQIEACVKKADLIFIDTCSILYKAAVPFLGRLVMALKRNGKKLYITTSVYAELDKHQMNKEDQDLAFRARQGLRLLKQLDEAGLMELIGDPNDGDFADIVFLTAFQRFRLKYCMMLITQDVKLAREIYAINKSQAVNGKKNIVKSIDEQGYLRNYTGFRLDNPLQEDRSSNEGKGSGELQRPEPVPSAEPVLPVPPVMPVQPLEPGQCFRVCEQVTSVPDSLMTVQEFPGEQQSAFTADREPVLLQKQVAVGGEGIIYETDSPYVAKIYKPEQLTRRRYEKIKLMIDKQLQYEGICFPQKLLYNQQGEFIGYLMPQAKGDELGSCVFRKMKLERKFPHWKKRDLVELALTILDKIKYLHQRNIILGDINPKNILVVSTKEAYFVDTDSYQIEDYPCPVGMTTFTAPEHQGDGLAYTDYLRKSSDDNFAIATLLFMIMLPGKPPYAQQGGATSGENIRRMDFSYPLGEKSNGKTPDGPWRFIWSHLTYKRIKEPFYNTFARDGKNSAPEKRLSVYDWIGNFNEYLRLLDTGMMAKKDYMSDWMFPTRYKHNDNVEYTRCRICGEMEAEAGRGDICRACLDDPKNGELYKCAKCGKELIVLLRDKIRQKKKFCCDECGQKVYTAVECSDCHRPFKIIVEEAFYYHSKGLHLPKRCPECLKRRRQLTTGSRQQTGRLSGHRTAVRKSSSGIGFWSALKEALFG